MPSPVPGTTPPDDYIVSRCGQKPLPPVGVTFSASAGVDKVDAGCGLPHGLVRFATVADIRSLGGSVVWMPELSRSGILNVHHVDVIEGHTGAFGDLEPNPTPKDKRIA